MKGEASTKGRIKHLAASRELRELLFYVNKAISDTQT